jgi:fluoride exporter
MSKGTIVLAIAAGGALGSLARYGLSRTLQGHGAVGLPMGTLAANLIGCLAIGFCYIWLDQRGSPVFRDFVKIGLLGGLTTFSTYAIETVSLIEKGRPLLAAGNALGSVVGGLTAAMVGIVLARMIFGPS